IRHVVEGTAFRPAFQTGFSRAYLPFRLFCGQAELLSTVCCVGMLSAPDCRVGPSDGIGSDDDLAQSLANWTEVYRASHLRHWLYPGSGVSSAGRD
ncbi:unnamed protein product, partial [Protopolystoma xenopodis]